MIDSEEQARGFVAKIADAEALARLEIFREELIAENFRQNLVSAASLEHIWLRHFADSAQLLEHVPRETGIWLDLGTGAGFPGLIVSIVRPEMPTVLVESRRKRADWLARMTSLLGLAKCRVEDAQIQALDTLEAGVISARAFAPLPQLIAISCRFSTSRTRWVLPKGRSAAQEVARLPESQRRMFHVEQSLTDPESGIIVGTGRPEAKP